jgi:hypothetical protein
MNEQEFANKIRAKYPVAYDNVSDTELTQKVITKYPVYASQVQIAKSALPTTPGKPVGRFAKFIDETAEDINRRSDRVADILARPDSSVAKKVGQIFGQGRGFETIPGAKTVISGLGKGIQWLAQTPPIKAIGEKIGESKLLQDLTYYYDNDPDFKDTVDAATNATRLGIDVGAVVSSANFVKNVTNKLIDKTKAIIPKPKPGFPSASEIVGGKITTSEGLKNTIATTGKDMNLINEGIRSGRIPNSQVYVKGDVLVSEVYNRLLNDIATKMNMNTPGLGAEFVKQISTNSGKWSVNQLIQAANQFVDKFVTTPLPTPPSNIVAGSVQKASELLERIPRGIKRLAGEVEEAAVKAERIRASLPTIGNAIKVNVPEVLIEGVSSADSSTLNAMKRTLDLAETKPKLGVKVQPSSVSGELAIKQFDLIDKQRVIIGKKLGEAVDELSKTVNVPMQDVYNNLDDILKQLDIVPTQTKTGVKLDFSKSNLSTAQKNKVQELYNLAREGGENLTPRQIYNKDRLFSQLKRESNLGEIGDVIVDMPDGTRKSMFNLFKDVYSKTLDEISPQNIRVLNLEYRKYRTMVDAIEDTLLRGGKNLEDVALLKKDPAEFAKVNLRRIFGDSASSAEFEAIATKMDELSRSLGYTDASPVVISNFANELRILYPETIPATGFQGGIRTSIKGLAENLLNVGKPNLTDQQKALRELIEALIREQSK